jgi:hypothetical protein
LFVFPAMFVVRLAFLPLVIGTRSDSDPLLDPFGTRQCRWTRSLPLAVLI